MEGRGRMETDGAEKYLLTYLRAKDSQTDTFH